MHIARMICCMELENAHSFGHIRMDAQRAAAATPEEGQPPQSAAVALAEGTQPSQLIRPPCLPRPLSLLIMRRARMDRRGGRQSPSSTLALPLHYSSSAQPARMFRPRPAENTTSLFEVLSLCLSRACLGKMIIFCSSLLQKSRKSYAFSAPSRARCRRTLRMQFLPANPLPHRRP